MNIDQNIRPHQTEISVIRDYINIKWGYNRWKRNNRKIRMNQKEKERGKGELNYKKPKDQKIQETILKKQSKKVYRTGGEENRPIH